MINPWVLLGIGAALITLCIGAFNAGQKYERSAWLEKAQQAEKKSQDNYEKSVESFNRRSVRYEEDKIAMMDKLRKERSYVYKILEVPKYSNCDLDDEGLRLWNGGSPPADTADSSKPSATVRNAKPVN